MASKQKKPRHFYDELYGCHFFFYIGWKFPDYMKHAQKHFGLIHDSSDREGSCSWSNERIVIWTSPTSDSAALAHECLHATNHVLDLAGVKADHLNDEPQTYYLTMLMRKALAAK